MQSCFYLIAFVFSPTLSSVEAHSALHRYIANKTNFLVSETSELLRSFSQELVTETKQNYLSANKHTRTEDPYLIRQRKKRNVAGRELNSRRTDTLARYGEMSGIDVDMVSIAGFSVGQLDRACRDRCYTNPDCEFWVRNTEGSECWLKRGFHSYGGSIEETKRRGAFLKAEENIGLVFIKMVSVVGTLSVFLSLYLLMLICQFH